MKIHMIIPIFILILITSTLSAKAGDEMHVLVLGQYEGRFETVMVTTYQSGSQQNRITSIPPGAVFLDGGTLLQQRQIVEMLAQQGIEPVMAELAKYLQIPMSSYLIVDYKGAQAVVDAMNGVYFDLPYALQLPAGDGKPALQLKAGMQLFDGDTARRFLRYRTGDLYGPQELQVMQLQQLFLDAMIRQLAQDKRKILPVAVKLPKMIKTNIGVFDILNLAYDAVTLDPDALRVDFGLIPGRFVKVDTTYQYQIKGAMGYHLR